MTKRGIELILIAGLCFIMGAICGMQWAEQYADSTEE